MSFRIKLNIPPKIKTLLNNPQSEIGALWKEHAIKKALLVVYANVAKNIVPGWGGGFKVAPEQGVGVFRGSGGGLLGSFFVDMDKQEIGLNKIYAAIQEYGGVITAKNAGALYVPISMQGRKIGPLKSKEAQKSSPAVFGKDFLLLGSVKIKEKKYFRRGIKSSLPQIRRIMVNVIKRFKEKFGL